MSKVGAADRSRLLRLKKAELSGIVKSRKRKLREIFAVCENESLIPQLDVSNPDAPPINPAEAHFLEITDILQDRLFNESNLPPRQPTSLDLSKKQSRSKTCSETQATDSAQKLIRSQQRDPKAKNQIILPGAQGGENKPIKVIKNGHRENVSKESPTSKSSSKGSQTDLPVINAIVPNGSPKASHEKVKARRKSIVETINPRSYAESNHKVKRVQSAILANQQQVEQNLARATQSSKRQFQKLDFQNKSDSKLELDATPAENVEENSLRETGKEEKKLGERSKNPAIAVSSPIKSVENKLSLASTSDAISATTIAPNETSTNTSLENGFSSHPERPGIKINGSSSSFELKKLREKNAIAIEQDSSSKVRKKHPRDIITKNLSNLESEKLLDKQVNAVHEENRESSVTKGGCDVVSNVIEKNDSVVCDLTIQDKTSLIPATVDNSSNIANFEIHEILNSKTRGQSPSVIVDAAPSQDISKDNNSNEAPHKSSCIASEKSHLAEGLIKPSLKPSLSSITQRIMPKIPSKPATIPPIVEQRRNTRIGSGVLERKTVSEIIGDAQMLAGTNSKPLTKSDSDLARVSSPLPRCSNLQNINPERTFELKHEKKTRGKLSNVIFSHRPTKFNPNVFNRAKTDKKSDLLKEDYFLPLFLANASTGKGCISALDTLLATANKTITTSDAYVPIHENQTAKILKRIYSLQSSHKWSLRQLKRSVEPIRPTHHWDVLLQESTWMRIDFKEERKWKRTAAKNMALACAEWVSLGQDERKLLQIKTKLPTFAPYEDAEISDEVIHDSIDRVSNLNIIGESRSPPIESTDETPCINLLATVTPIDLFDPQYKELVFELRSPRIQKLLNELPMYGNPLQIPKPDPWSPEYNPDRFWKRPTLPLSKYVEGKLHLKLDPPPRKSSRFEYEVDDEEENRITFGEEKTKPSLLPPESTEVALFNSKYKHLLERIRNANCFVPPSEFQMPLQSFFEFRTASQWTWDEDKELKMLVRDYTYNWSLISSILSSKSKSILTTGAERRTPWECFERWVELEGLPIDMQKSQYFKVYTTRIENANKNLTNAPPPQNAQGQIQQSRKRSSASVRVERRRNQKHLVLIDTMRKLAKKRETALQKQQHAAGLAAMRKAQEVAHIGNKNMPPSTPQDFSRLKHDREEVVKERLLHLQQRQEAQRRAVMAQRNSGLNPQQHGHLSLTRPSTGVPLALNGSNLGNKSHNVPGQNRSYSGMPPISNHSMPDGLHMTGLGINTIPPAPMQSQTSLSNPSLDVGLVSKAHAISQHQQAILRQQQHQQQQQQHQKQQQAQIASQPSQASQVRNSPILRMNNLSAPGFPMQSNMISPFPQSLNGLPTPSTKSLLSTTQAISSQLSQLAQPPQPLSHVQRIEIQYKAKYPTATPEQITSMISKALNQTQALNQSIQRQNIAQNAINAAAGRPLVGISGVGAPQGTPQLYAQMLRQQQENQQKQQPAIIGNNFQTNKQGGSGSGSSGTGHANRASSGSLSNPK